jgi:hypothetical protein
MNKNETVYTPIIKKIQEMRYDGSNYVSNGGASSYEEYRETCGKIEATKQIEEEIKTIEKRFIED